MSASGKKKHEEEKDKQSEEIESLKAQLSAAQKENEKLNGGMFDMFKTTIGAHIYSIVWNFITLFLQVC